MGWGGGVYRDAVSGKDSMRTGHLSHSMMKMKSRERVIRTEEMVSANSKEAHVAGRVTREEVAGMVRNLVWSRF